jgi:hypothetical protein
MPAEPANEDSVAWHLARRELLNAWPVIGLKPEEISVFYAKSMCAAAHSAKRLPLFYALVDRASGDSVIPSGARAKTNVWGSPNQSDIQINLRRMEQFVLVNLCCHS